MSNQKTLARSKSKVIAGVCAGVAEYFGWDIAVFRAIFLLVSIFSAAFPGVLVYIILWIVMPDS
jgi:phage shock protein PspC (stress-responsive transcriptional regulator)